MHRRSENFWQKMVMSTAKREAIAFLRGRFQMSERRAADRKIICYCYRQPLQQALRARLRELANERSRFGYLRLFILLRQEGEVSGINSPLSRRGPDRAQASRQTECDRR